MTRLKTIALAVSTLGLVATTAPAFGGEVEDLKAALKKLTERLDQLETQQKTQAATQAAAPAALPANVVTAGDIPGSIKIPGTETSLKVYGYAQFDATYDLKSRGTDPDNNDWASFVAVQPLTKTADGKRKDQLYATARTSRIGLETSTPTENGILHTKIEGDFNAPNAYSGETLTNSVLFRLRHAYGELGNFLVGQTWSNFSDLGSYVDSVDFNGVGTVPFVRQAQVRYTFPLGSSSKLALSVENSQADPANDGAASHFDKTPDFIANFTTTGDWGHFSLRGVAQQYRNDAHTKQAWGLGAGGSLKFGKDTLVAQINGGNGIGRYTLNSAYQRAYDDGSSIHLWKAVGAHVGYTHVWNSTVRSNLILAHTKFTGDSTTEALTDNATGGLAVNKKIDEALINTFWGVAKNTEVGLEYAYGKRTTFAGDTGTQNRINATIHYNLF
ncbi:hypothetical protein HCX48_11260 [Rhodocyclus tenuis]|uniref:Porin n=2 Tax=Rhodocyclus TaxID=1064 RepID=A0A6L5JXJ8_RHOTE|nr:DcaP family trimeric outer membrane transporter [Rhodocyclus gracilis]MQY51949.1 hypothetical protein [Rhodocyclus gracilis]MRD73727.1 hypothetical protein [Rhodocyclus gracilis]NJA89797.1 hypothetical protein [Rhodocyclus gracilis]